jgi:hypothetical protein
MAAEEHLVAALIELETRGHAARPTNPANGTTPTISSAQSPNPLTLEVQLDPWEAIDAEAAEGFEVPQARVFASFLT